MADKKSDRSTNSKHESADQAHKGGKSMPRDNGSHGSSGDTSHRSGNFKDDPERAAEAGRKGGERSHTGSRK